MKVLLEGKGRKSTRLEGSNRREVAGKRISHTLFLLIPTWRVEIYLLLLSVFPTAFGFLLLWLVTTWPSTFNLQILLTFLIPYHLFSYLFMTMHLSLREFLYYHYTGISRGNINQNREILLALYSVKLILLYIIIITLWFNEIFYRNRKNNPKIYVEALKPCSF